MLPLLLITMLLTSCGTSGQSSYCLITRPIYLSKQDALTANTAREILNHNETWEHLCDD